MRAFTATAAAIVALAVCLAPTPSPHDRCRSCYHFVPLCIVKDLHTTTLCVWHSTSCLHPRAACWMPVTKHRQSAARRVVTRTGRDMTCCAPALPRWAVLARPRTRTVARNSPYEVHFVLAWRLCIKQRRGVTRSPSHGSRTPASLVDFNVHRMTVTDRPCQTFGH